MKKLVTVDRDHVQLSVFYAIKKVLRAWLGKGDHDPLARKAADGVMEHFELSNWSVQGSPLEPHSTPGPRRDPGSAD